MGERDWGWVRIDPLTLWSFSFGLELTSTMIWLVWATGPIGPIHLVGSMAHVMFGFDVSMANVVLIKF